jgi:hypothetical protein
MYQQIVLYANLSGYNSHNRKSLELFTLFKKSLPCKVILNPDYRIVKNSIVIVSGYSTAFKSFDSSNFVYYLSRTGSLDFREITLLPHIDAIIACSQLEASNLAWQTKYYGYKIITVSHPPYCKEVNVENNNIDIIYTHVDNKYRPVFVEYNLIKTNKVQSAFANIHLTDSPAGWPYLVLESMAAGIPSIVKVTNPVSEYIINGHNGYVISDMSDLVSSLTELKYRREEIATNCKAISRELFSPQRYSDRFINLSKNRDLNIFGPVKIEHQNRRWIIREKIVRDKDSVYFPDTYDNTIQAIDLAEITEILEFFSVQLFSDVYVFGCDLPDWYGPEEMIQASSLVAKLGNRASKIHFCRDELIPHQWSPIFKKLSLISVDEGLKQISDKT